jgi:hypothetical protein
LADSAPGRDGGGIERGDQLMSVTVIALAIVAAAQAEPAQVGVATSCPKGLAGLECKAQRLNTALADPAVQSGIQLFSLLAKKKPKPATAATADAGAAPTADAPATDAP